MSLSLKKKLSPVFKESYQHYYIIFLFSEIVTVLLSNISLNLILVPLLIIIYVIISVIGPWAYIYISINAKKILIVFFTPILSLFLFTLVIKLSTIQLQFFFTLMFLKILMAGLSSLSRFFILIYIDKPKKRPDFQFQQNKYVIEEDYRNKVRMYLWGTVIFIFILPAVLLGSVGLILKLK